MPDILTSQFWSSADLTGNQTLALAKFYKEEFWSSADLTGNQTDMRKLLKMMGFWSSADLTGNQTYGVHWSSLVREDVPAKVTRHEKGPAGAGPSASVLACSDAGGEKPRHESRAAIRNGSPCR